MQSFETNVKTDQNALESMIDDLCHAQAYPECDAATVDCLETHISWVFLVGDCAYKFKKPVRTPFLDYSTLAQRKQCCEQELRLGRRYAPDLYLEVVPVTIKSGKPIVEGEGVAIDYGVKMRRFPAASLLSERLDSGNVSSEDILQLAHQIADFHGSAEKLNVRGEPDPLGSIELIEQHAIENLQELSALLRDVARDAAAGTLRVLADWTRSYFDERRSLFAQRAANGFVRECHGDLHLANIVHWHGKFVPFDGVEFNASLRWIDVINDAAFVAMDLAAHRRLEWCRSFINAYLEQTGDHASLAVMRWYLVYRALVRAKVAAIRASQATTDSELRDQSLDDCQRHIDLAYRFTLREQPALWITHGVSGSGKTTLSESIVQQHGAIRLRSDIERKRHFGMSPLDRPNEAQKAKLYSEQANHATYARLRRLARCILRAGYPVIIDATFLRTDERQLFRSLAQREGATFGIFDCHASEPVLRQRISQRSERDNDASDADLKVMQHQLAIDQPLTAEELRYVTVPQSVKAVETDSRFTAASRVRLASGVSTGHEL